MFCRKLIKRDPDLKAVASVYVREACGVMTSFQGDLIFDYDLMQVCKSHTSGDWELWFFVRSSGTHAFRKGDPMTDSVLTDVATMFRVVSGLGTRVILCVRYDSAAEDYVLEQIEQVGK